jgi:hypothetical protein
MSEEFGRLGVGQFRLVPLAELLVRPFARVVPAAQLRRRGEGLGPLVHPGRLLLQAARPQPVDQDAYAVVRLGRVVHATDANAHGRAFLGRRAVSGSVSPCGPVTGTTRRDLT